MSSALLAACGHRRLSDATYKWILLHCLPLSILTRCIRNIEFLHVNEKKTHCRLKTNLVSPSHLKRSIASNRIYVSSSTFFLVHAHPPSSRRCPLRCWLPVDYGSFQTQLTSGYSFIVSHCRFSIGVLGIKKFCILIQKKTHFRLKTNLVSPSNLTRSIPSSRLYFLVHVLLCPRSFSTFTTLSSALLAACGQRQLSDATYKRYSFNVSYCELLQGLLGI